MQLVFLVIVEFATAAVLFAPLGTAAGQTKAGADLAFEVATLTGPYAVPARGWASA